MNSLAMWPPPPQQVLPLRHDAQRMWRRQPDEARLFEVHYLLGIVWGTGQAGVRGTLTRADGSPAADVTVTVRRAKEPVTAVSDGDGRYVLAVAAGSYTLVFGGAGYVGREEPVTVEAGVKKRVDGVMGEI